MLMLVTGSDLFHDFRVKTDVQWNKIMYSSCIFCHTDSYK